MINCENTIEVIPSMDRVSSECPAEEKYSTAEEPKVAAMMKKNLFRCRLIFVAS